MPTLRHAAELLVASNSRDGRIAIARFLQFAEEPLTLDAAARRRLSLPAEITRADLLGGRGSLRALSIEVSSGAPLRHLLPLLATALHQSSAHVLWLVIASTVDGREVGVATWYRGARGTRVSALVVQREHIIASDAETLVSLSAACDGDDLLVHTRWCELLGREALSRRFYRVLEERVADLASSLTGAPADVRHELALLYVSRLLFLSFLETKGWLNGDHAFLARHYDTCMATGGRYHQRVLLPLFFGTLNTRISKRSEASRRFGAVPFLNGGLFSRTALEKRHARVRFSDAAFGKLFGELLSAFRFTARESDDQLMEASIDPEMLGRAFESLMVSRERRASGAFYTPHQLVDHLTTRALGTALANADFPVARALAALHGESLSASEQAHLRATLDELTVLDPACGSGAFLVHVLEQISTLRRACGDTRDLSTIRRDVLGRNIHGVDINPTAVWLCELRLWLSVVIESTETRMSAVPPLPNLDCNVRVGDSLADNGFQLPPALVGPSAALSRLHTRYVRASGPGKATLRRAIQRDERHRAVAGIDRELSSLANRRRERVRAQRAADLFGLRHAPDAGQRAEMRCARLRVLALRRERRRLQDGGALPFAFASHFATVHARGGFRLIIGNPPWVRIHNIPLAARTSLRARFEVYRDAAWTAATANVGAPNGFASQVDLASLFVERSADLVAPSGCVALLLPVKLWRSLAGGGVRRLISSRLWLREIEDWSAAPATFDAAVYPSLVIATRDTQVSADVLSAVHFKHLVAQWRGKTTELRLIGSDSASPFLLLPPQARRAFDLIRSHGNTLADSALGRPTLGVKCGHNDAFLVDALGERGNDVSIAGGGRRGAIEREFVRPLLRGDALTPWSVRRSPTAIVWTHDASGSAVSVLPPGTANWLAPWKRQLLLRSDLRTPRTWWTLFRTDGADSSRTRVVWGDFGRRPRALVLAAGDRTVPLNTCYVVHTDDRIDALTLCALINSPLAAAWLNTIAEPARGGWHRYLAWTVSLLPLPAQWDVARDLLAPLAERGMMGDAPSDAELLATACAAYAVQVADVEPLLEWAQIQPSH